MSAAKVSQCLAQSIVSRSQHRSLKRACGSHLVVGSRVGDGEGLRVGDGDGSRDGKAVGLQTQLSASPDRSSPTGALCPLAHPNTHEAPHYWALRSGSPCGGCNQLNRDVETMP